MQIIARRAGARATFRLKTKLEKHLSPRVFHCRSEPIKKYSLKAESKDRVYFTKCEENPPNYTTLLGIFRGKAKENQTASPYGH